MRIWIFLSFWLQEKPGCVHTALIGWWWNFHTLVYVRSFISLVSHCGRTLQLLTSHILYECVDLYIVCSENYLSGIDIMVDFCGRFKIKILSLITHPHVVPNMWDLCSSSEHKLKSESFLTLHRQQCNYHVQGPER